MAVRRQTPLTKRTIEASTCSLELKLRILRGLPFLSSLDEAAVRAVSGLFHEKGFGPEEFIYLAGSPANRLYAVADGAVKLIDRNQEGRGVVLDILGQGDFFGHFAGAPEEAYPHSAQAVTSTCALVTSYRELRQILTRYPAVAVDLLRVFAARLRSAQEQVRRMSSDPVEMRIASALLRLAGRFGKREEPGMLIDLPLSREALAEMSGTTTETASRIVTLLQREGAIRTGRQWVAIVDPARLAVVAGNAPRRPVEAQDQNSSIYLH
jgi:CRP-like cAMP-binding protein